MRETSNPVFRSLPKEQGGYAQFGTGAAGYGAQAVQADPYVTQYPDQQQTGVSRPLTIDDVVTKTGITLAVLTAVAVVSYFLVAQNLALAMPLRCSSAVLGGLALVLIATFGRKQDNPAIVLSYAALEGLFLGAFSFMIANLMCPGVSAGALISQAILGTIGVFFGMLVVYKTGAIRVTPKFTRLLVAAMFGVLALMLGQPRARRCSASAAARASACAAAARSRSSSRCVLHRPRGVQLPDRLRRRRPDDPRRRAGEGRMGHRPRPDRHAGLALHRDPAAAQLLQQRLAALTRKPGTTCAGLFLCASTLRHRSRFIHRSRSVHSHDRPRLRSVDESLRTWR